MRLLFKRAALVATGFIVAVIVAEVVLRLFQLAPAVSVVTVTEDEYARVPGIFSPGQDLVERSIRQLPYHVVIDSLGFRGEEFPRRKPPGETRVLMLGDSFTFGEFVSEDETIARMVEGLLQRDCPSLRVINGGLPGSTITDQREMLRRALSLEPDFVVLVMTTNDLKDLMAETLWPRLAENRVVKSRFPLSVAYPVLRHLALFNLLQRVRAVTFNHRAAADAVAKAPHVPDSVRMLPAKQRYDRELLAIRDTLDALKVPFLFVLVPDHLLVSGKRVDPTIDWESATARTAGIAALDLLTVYRETRLPVTRLYLLPYDGHTGPTGNLVAANAVSRRLVDEGLTANCRSTVMQAGKSPGD